VVFPGKHNGNPKNITSNRQGSDVQATLAGDLLSGSRKMTRGEVVTDTGAIAAIASPWWLPSLHDVSHFAAEWLPILGAIWLVVQTGVKLHTTYWRK